MAEEKRITDASGAQMAARRHLEGEHGKNLTELKVRKCWYTTGTSRDIWEVEGIAVIKKGMFGKEQRSFKYQIDPTSGAVIGFEQQ